MRSLPSLAALSLNSDSADTGVDPTSGPSWRDDPLLEDPLDEEPEPPSHPRDQGSDASRRRAQPAIDQATRGDLFDVITRAIATSSNGRDVCDAVAAWCSVNRVSCTDDVYPIAVGYWDFHPNFLYARGTARRCVCVGGVWMATTLIWHRHDCRLQDNVLYDNGAGASTLSVYCFDPSQFARVPSCVQPEWDVIRTGPHQARMLLGAVASLRESLRALGSELIIRSGDPASVLPQLALRHQVERVRWHEEPGTDESESSASVRAALLRIGCQVSVDYGGCLYHPDDLPDANSWAALAHPRQKQGRKRHSKKEPCKKELQGVATSMQQRLVSMPRVMGEWRRAVRASTSPRPILAAPTRLRSAPLPCSSDEISSMDETSSSGGVSGGTSAGASGGTGGDEAGALPSLADLVAPALAPCSGGRLLFGLPDEIIHAVVSHAVQLSASCDGVEDEYGAWARSGLCTGAGEVAAHVRLAHFIGGGHAACATTGDADTSTDGSSKLSTALALGCLSPRQVYTAAVAHGEGAQWLASHMEMRDFFVYSAFAAGAALFRRDGWRPVQSLQASLCWRAPAEDLEAWQHWATGRIGLPLPDAAMRELARTGYCSNRARQNAASVLTKDLGFDWRAGAEWFQWLLADHDVAANWGNWAYFSGVGADPKQRHFRTISQALRYDPEGGYVRTWLTELASVAGMEAALRPFAHGVAGWPSPLVDPSTQLSWQDAQRLEQTGRLVPSTEGPHAL